jgi:ferric-dicitrate binding protein FerR (iron transport regulator)
MSHSPRTAFRRWPVLSILIALSVMFVSVSAQEQESFEGFINRIRANAITGVVVFQREDGKFALEQGLQFEDGDFVRTGGDGYAELLLQPGNYLRVGSDSECQILSDQHDKMRFKLNRGSISIEILARDASSSFLYTPEQAGDPIRVITPNATVFITRPGIFRISATGGRTQVVARNGEAVINGQRVKDKRRAVAANGSVTMDTIDDRSQDAFDVWARERAESLIKANKSLKRDSPWAEKAKEGKEMSVEFPDEETPENNGRVISAKPGSVSFVEDGVEVLGSDGEWKALTEKSQPETGDGLRTDTISFVELILFPDMHLRLDSTSEVLFKQLSNDAISIKLLRGSAILDVARFDRKQVPQISIEGPSTSAVIDREGNYRIDVKPNDEAITIREGKVIYNERPVGSCRRISGGTVADCDKKRYDNFDFWSEHRGEGELFNGRVTVAMATHLVRVRISRFKNTGFWYQQPGQTFYTFVPFTSVFFKSPYGGNYSTVLSARPGFNRIFTGPGPKPTFRQGPQRLPRTPDQ